LLLPLLGIWPAFAFACAFGFFTHCLRKARKQRETKVDGQLGAKPGIDGWTGKQLLFVSWLALAQDLLMPPHPVLRLLWLLYKLVSNTFKSNSGPGDLCRQGKQTARPANTGSVDQIGPGQSLAFGPGPRPEVCRIT